MSRRRVSLASAPSRDDATRLSLQVIVAIVALAVLACIVAASLLLSSANAERVQIRADALRTAVALSFGFDQEVAAVNYLLKGLSTSPALASGDIAAFHRQMQATAVPPGSWLILQDLNGQVANSLRAFGDRLPTRQEMPNYDALIARLHIRPWTVSGRLVSALNGQSIVGLSLRIDSPDGELRSWLTTILSEQRLHALLDARMAGPGWTRVLYDRDFVPVVSSGKGEDAPRAGAPAALRQALSDVDLRSSRDGVVEGADERGEPIVVAYRRSDATNWTVAVIAPLAQVNAPLTDVARRLISPALLLLIVGGAVALVTARQIELPIRSLTSMVARARGEVAELSGQLLSLQEEERRRIARELHDSTVQHLVATNLGLARLETQLDCNPEEAKRASRDASGEVQQALNELRVFTYLLHPPDLSRDGLAQTLRDFILGFGRRSGLTANLRIPDVVNAASSPLQLALLRVVQEALVNVNRHARATRVHVSARVVAGWLFLRVSDDGQGMAADAISDAVPLGVGIPGMRARLRQFRGDLRIITSSSGTTILAHVPLSDHA